MGYLRAQVELLNDTLLPGDVAMNTWHFVTPGTPAGSHLDVVDLLEDFYLAVDTYLSTNLSGTVRVKSFDLEDPSPRVPVGETTFSITPGGSSNLPNEVALVMSFQGPIVSGTDQARRRGRLFLGPLNTTVNTTGIGDARPASGALVAILAAAEVIADQTTYPGLIWSVFSRTSAGPEPWTTDELANAFVTVTNGWMDNAYDTMRSRGLPATTRAVWP